MSVPLQKIPRHRILLLATFLFVTLLGVMAFVVSPGVDPDSCWGYLVMHSMQRGHPFNLIPSPNPFNIAKDRFDFLAWWSPGQYMEPWLLQIITGFKIDRATTLATAFSSTVGLAGFYQLFKKLGFTKWIAAISAAFIATQQFFISPFWYYRGGDALLFEFEGWFLYGCFSFRKVSWKAFLFIFLSGLVGFFLKSSFMWMYAAGMACMWINISYSNTPAFKFNKQDIWLWFKTGLLLAIPFIAATVIIYKCYILKGDTPAANTSTTLIVPETFTYPLASPILSAFSTDRLTSGLLYHPDTPLLSYNQAIVLLVVFTIACLIFLFVIYRHSPDKNYPVAMITSYLVAFVFFGYMFLKQAAISYEDRHFLMLGLLFIPGFVYLCFKTKAGKLLFFLCWTVFIGLDVYYINYDYTGNLEGARGKTGLSQQVYEQEVVDEMVKLDEAHANNALFVVNSPDIALELTHNRVLIIDHETPEVVMQGLKYRGKAGTIYILFTGTDATDGRQNYIQKSLVDYHHFTKKTLSPGYFLVTATY